MSKDINKKVTRKIRNKEGKEITLEYNEIDAKQIESFMFYDNPETGETEFNNGIVIELDNRAQEDFEQDAKLTLVVDHNAKESKEDNKDNKEDEGR